MKYRKLHTYLVREVETNEFVRWQGDNTIFFAGSVEDALIGLPKDLFEAVRVCDAPEDIQREYEKRIDECIASGEIELSRLIPTEIKVNVYYYIDDEGKPQFDTDEMSAEFVRKLNELEKTFE
jgi:hypothetical protein